MHVWVRVALWQDAARPIALAALAAISLFGYRAFWPLKTRGGWTSPPFPVVELMLGLLVPYVAACWLVLAVRGPRTILWRCVEWVVLVGGAMVFRAVVLPLRPLLSPDVYRYVWDARLTAHGLSPYLHGPSWSGFAWLRDSALYPHVPWKDVPTIYPPGAQLLYRLAYAVAPSNVWGIKVEMTLFDLLAGAILVLLLLRRGQDPRRAMVYLWAPLCVVEFAIDGHEDAAAIVFILAALLVNTFAFRGSRALVGVLLGIATLIKLYPLVLVVALVRRRDWTLLAGVALTVAAGYTPFWHDGLAALGFLSTYLTQVQVSYGGALLLVRVVGFRAGLTAGTIQAIGTVCALVGLATIAWLRVRGARREAPAPLALSTMARSVPGIGKLARRLGALDGRIPARLTLGPIGAALALIVLWLAFSPHVFPWYATALLPFCALLLEVPIREPAAAVALGVWTFASLIPIAYDAFESAPLAWLYPALYLMSVALAGVAWYQRSHSRFPLAGAFSTAATRAAAPASAQGDDGPLR